MATVVQASQVCKSYGSQSVLQNFDFHLQEGNIYTLLGASGSGKTTLLSLIVGLIRAEKGRILVFDKQPGDRSSGIPGPRLGYMPQDTGLHKEFTVQETFCYFGRLYGMSNDSIKDQGTFLSDLLELPHQNHRVDNCSGGQKRRLSLAVALMHYPDLLVLDEPTVGVDPILRQKIWFYLKSLAINHMKTILVTTHFIEETSFADKIGFLRNGKVLAEDSQVNLLARYRIDSIDKLFLEMSLQSESRQFCQFTPEIESNTVEEGNPNLKGNFKNYKQKSTFFSKLWALVVMNFIKVKRNPSFVILMILLPILTVSSFCSTVGKEPKNLKIGVFNEENCITDNLTVSECDYETFSCRILMQIQKHDMFHIQTYQNETAMVQDLQSGMILGFVKFPQNFSSALTQRIFGLEESEDYDYGDYGNYGDYFVAELPSRKRRKRSLKGHLEITEETLNQSLIEIQLDTSSYPLTVSITETLFDEMKTFLKDFLVTCSFPEYLARLPYSLEDPVTKIGLAGTTDFRTFMAPGFMIMVIFFLSSTLTGDTFIEGKEDGTFLRSWAAGVENSQIILAFIIANLFNILIQALIYIVFMFIIFQLPIYAYGDLAWILLILELQGYCGMCFGFSLAATFSNHASFVHAGIGCFFPVFILSGSFWPLDGAPAFLRISSWYLPCTYAVQAVRDIMTKGWAASVYHALISTLVWIGIFIVAASIAVKIRSPK